MDRGASRCAASEQRGADRALHRDHRRHAARQHLLDQGDQLHPHARGAAPEARDTPAHIDRFVVSQAITMALAGIPALYFHSLVATHNDRGGVEATGMSRAINRRRYDAGELDRTLAQDSAPATVLARLKHLLVVRAAQPAFHPDADQTVVDLGPGLFALERKASGQTLLAIHNVSDTAIDIPTHHAESIPVTIHHIQAIGIGKRREAIAIVIDAIIAILRRGLNHA